MNNPFKFLFIGLIALCGLISARAADKVTASAVSATTPLTILTGANVLVKDILFINGNTTNAATVKFYDSASNGTNIIIGGRTVYSSYTTNYNIVHTNAAGIVITNTVSGLYTYGTAVGQTTNERPTVVGPYLVTANGSRTVADVNLAPLLGLTIYSTQAGTVEVTYEVVNQ
jgi:hypothetical protein